MKDILRKVRSLLALADPKSNGTEPERATARAMANKLMAEHGLSKRQIPLRETEGGWPPPPKTHRHSYRVVVNFGTFGGLGDFGDFSFGFTDSTTSNTTVGT